MKKYFFITVIFLLMCAAFLPGLNVRAQTEPAYVVGHTTPVSQGVIDSVNYWLEDNPPLPTDEIKYYAITCNDEIGATGSRYICLAGLNIENPGDEWTIFSSSPENPRNGVWFGTLIVYSDGSVHRHDTPPVTKIMQFKKSAMVQHPKYFAGGGGNHVRFPFEPGKALTFYDTEPCIWSCENPANARTVYFRSGEDYGSFAANDSVYASVSGNIDWVCESFGSVRAVRIDGGADLFYYGGLFENENLVIGHSFAQNEIIATLRHGSYVNTCDGTVGQSETEWSLWWGVIMGDDDVFVAEGAVLDDKDGLTPGYGNYFWTCKGQVIKPHQTMGHCDNTVNGGSHNESFWSYMIDGFYGIFDAFYTSLMPANMSAEDLITPLLNSVKVLVRIAAVLLIGQFNLGPAVAMIIVAISMRAVIGVIQVIGAIIRIVKSIPFVP